MGTCQVKFCRCTCQEGRLGCQCGSENTIMLEEQSREIRRRRITQDQMVNNINSDKQRRSNRFENQKSRAGSPAQSNSSGSQNKTKFSTYRKATNKSPNSVERYLLSQECNIPTDHSQQDNKRKPKIRDQAFKIGQIYFKKEDYDFQFQQVTEKKLNTNEIKMESPHFQNSKKNLENKQSLDQIQSIQDPSASMKTPTTTALEVTNNRTMSNPILNQHPSISKESSPTKISHPITQVSIGPISNKQSLSVITDQQQLKNRSRTADLFDDQKSVTIRSVLKKKQKNDDSFRTQQQESRKVRFDLPNSHYIRERQRQQPRLYQ
ncbi:unnamed protein product [Paramecium octaurelia]|uniref:Uncharacterized protein n=1 Tax=Paramecium octaurelia TaxID=43137 RepID=A0A8S1V245_PAROT|nr:unnamed protein product [Paramecium octaurelia]